MKDQIKFYCLQRDFISHGAFELYELEARESGKAWEEIEESISAPTSQEWLMNNEELEILKRLLK